MSDDKRFIPSWETIRKASLELPKPKEFRDNIYHAPVGERLISFKKIKFKTRLGSQTKWVYDGKVMMD